jgi:hypothetical protein
MTQDEQIKFLGLDKLNALDRLNVILLGNFQLTGSISLFEHGIIKRQISDIDIVVDSLDRLKVTFDKKGCEFQEWFDYSEPLENPSLTLQRKGKVTNRISFKIGEVNCCAFFGKKQEFKIFEYMLDRKFKVSHPIYAIQAKKKYVTDLFKMDTLDEFQLSRLKKHISDIQSFYEKFEGDLIFPF